VAFFERFRVELSKYDEGVHELGEPAARPPAWLPRPLADFYRSWNGARLFFDAIVILPVEKLAQAAEIGIGEWPDGDLYWSDGRVHSRGEDGASIVVGSTLERFLAAMMAREGVLVDAAGEWNDVFDDEGVEMRAQKKQTRLALAIDPESAAWQLEGAEHAFADGDDDAAERALTRAVALDENAGDAWALLGALQRRSGRAKIAAHSFERAYLATPVAATRAERAAEAARAASEASDTAAAARYTEAARLADVGSAARWLDEAKALLERGDEHAARNRATLVAAIAPEEAAPLVQRLRLKRSLRPIS
jgi:Tfp pilus assembly protein PilF